MTRFSYSELASVVGSLFVLVGGFYLAYLMGDPHIVRRGGAALVIYSLIFAFRAHLLDEARQRLEKGKVKPLPDFASPTEKLSGELAELIREYRRSAVTMSVSRVFRVHLVMACLGEVLHGFGDLIFIAIFGSMANGH